MNLEEAKVQQKSTDSNIPKAVAINHVVNQKKIDTKDKNVIANGNEPPFIEKANQYYFISKEGPFRCSNFIMNNTYLIKGKDPKRVIIAENTYGIQVTFTITSNDFASIQKFKSKTEGLGNFIWFGSASHLNQVKSILFQKAIEAEEITYLGYNSLNDVYCFSNGIFNGSLFIDSDTDGFCSNGDIHFYIPFKSEINEFDSNYDNYRKFIHRPNTIVNFEKWCNQFYKVYRNNGVISVAYIIASVFRDIVFSYTMCFPHLFFFGQPQSGKTAISDSVMSLFGFPQTPINLEAGSTAVGSFRKLEQMCNSIVSFNEYKNTIDAKIIGLLKAAYDGQGRERGNYTNDSTTKTSQVRSGLIIAGQDLPSNDPALFSRIIPLTIMKRDSYTNEETENYQLLREMEKSGITNALLDILKHRLYFKESFASKHKSILRQLKAEFANLSIDERSLINYSILLASVEIIQNKVVLPFNIPDFKKLLSKNLQEYSKMLKISSDVSKFWEAFENLCSSSKLVYDKHYTIKRTVMEPKGNEERVLYLRWKIVYPEYRNWMFLQRNTPLSDGTILKYLQSSPEYVKSENAKFGFNTPIHSHWFKLDPLNLTLYTNSDNN